MDNSAYMSMILQEEGAVAYICGMATYDMLYLTDSGLALYGLASAREFHGRKCYEPLQGLDSPCPFCTNCMIAGARHTSGRGDRGPGTAGSAAGIRLRVRTGVLLFTPLPRMCSDRNTWPSPTADGTGPPFAQKTGSGFIRSRFF